MIHGTTQPSISIKTPPAPSPQALEKKGHFGGAGITLRNVAVPFLQSLDPRHVAEKIRQPGRQMEGLVIKLPTSKADQGKCLLAIAQLATNVVVPLTPLADSSAMMSTALRTVTTIGMVNDLCKPCMDSSSTAASNALAPAKNIGGAGTLPQPMGELMAMTENQPSHEDVSALMRHTMNDTATLTDLLGSVDIDAHTDSHESVAKSYIKARATLFIKLGTSMTSSLLNSPLTALPLLSILPMTTAFQCGNSRLKISENLTCTGFSECGDNTDETVKSCCKGGLAGVNETTRHCSSLDGTKTFYACSSNPNDYIIKLESYCDGVPQCDDASDELAKNCCEGGMFNTTTHSCFVAGSNSTKNYFVCNDEGSRQSSDKCNAVITCKDGSDEKAVDCCKDGVFNETTRHCVSERLSKDLYVCKDKNTILAKEQCNGIPQCADRSDEVGCPTTSNSVTMTQPVNMANADGTVDVMPLGFLGVSVKSLGYLMAGVAGGTVLGFSLFQWYRGAKEGYTGQKLLLRPAYRAMEIVGCAEARPPSGLQPVSPIEDDLELFRIKAPIYRKPAAKPTDDAGLQSMTASSQA